MKNDTNIYDIDGTLIRKAGDNHKFTIEEVENLVDMWTEKVRENPDNQVYKVYLNNANRWLYHLYNNMSKEELAKRLTAIQDTLNEAKSEQSEAEQKQINKLNDAIEKLKEEYEPNVGRKVESSVSEHMEQPMDSEYVDYEEVK